MFLNHYDHSIDEKGRITIPAKYRDQLQGGAFLTKDLIKPHHLPLCPLSGIP